MATMGGPVPAMGRYDPSRGRYDYNTGAFRDGHHQAGPSPWVPATILGVIVLITAMPYMRTADATRVYYRETVVRASRGSSFPMPLLWIPVVAAIALQFFGSSGWYHGVYVGDRGAYGARPGGAAGGGWWAMSGLSRSQPYRRYNAHQQRGLLSTFMDYGGHWFLILLGVAVFTLVSSSSVASSRRAARVRVVPMAPRRLGFPWSLISRLFF